MDEPRLLLVEKDPALRMQLEIRLERAGFKLKSVDTFEQALALLRAEGFAVMVCDLPPQCDAAVPMLSRARDLAPDLELIILGGAASIEAAFALANCGVYAFLRWPLRPGELEERALEASARRQTRIERRAALWQLFAQLLGASEPARAHYSVTDGARLRVGRLELDPQQRRAAIDRRTVPLSDGEFELLLYLARREQQVISAERLAREALRCGNCTPAEARDLVKVRIYRLRRKLEQASLAPGLLVSVRGSGYMLTAGE